MILTNKSLKMPGSDISARVIYNRVLNIVAQEQNESKDMHLYVLILNVKTFSFDVPRYIICFHSLSKMENCVVAFPFVLL